MKKFMALILCLTVCVLSFSTCFAEEPILETPIEEPTEAVESTSNEEELPEIVEYVDLDDDVDLDDEELYLADILDEDELDYYDYYLFGERFRFETDLTFDDFTPFIPFDGMLENWSYNLGYMPDFSVNYDKRIVYVYLFEDHYSIPALIDDVRGTILIQDNFYPTEVFEENELYCLIPDGEYKLLSWLDLRDYDVTCLYDQEEQGLEIDMVHVVNGIEYENYTFFVPNVERILSNGDYVIDSESYRQIYYELYRYRD